MVIIDFLLALLSGLIITLIRQSIVYKRESNKWKEEHSERLAKLEEHIKLIDKT